MNQRSVVFLCLLFLISVLCTGACLAQNDTRHGITQAASELGLETFSKALEGSGLADELNNQGVLVIGSGSFVVFAPSDDAFSSSKEIDMNSVLENKSELKSILGHMMVWNGGAFTDISELSSVRTLQGENLTLNASNGLMVDGANVTATKAYDNGTIYVIDKVLLPKKLSGPGVLEAANDLGAKKFASALKSEGFEERLNGQGVIGIESLSEGPFTIFAPSDAAFDEAKAAVDAISKKDAGMKTLLAYHAIGAADLTNMTDSYSVKTLGGDSLAVDPAMSLVGGAIALRSERYDNGIVYLIDQVLVPVRLSM
jgi:uncharacterized surface protein with fasciclin (FAS1) repeats